MIANIDNLKLAQINVNLSLVTFGRIGTLSHWVYHVASGSSKKNVKQLHDSTDDINKSDVTFLRSCERIFDGL